MIDIFEYIKRQLEYCETATNIEKYNVDTYSKDNMTDEQMSGYYRGRIEMLYAIKHYLEVGNIVLPQTNVIKSIYPKCNSDDLFKSIKTDLFDCKTCELR